MILYELHAAAKRLEIDLEHLLIYVPIPPPQSLSPPSSSSSSYQESQANPKLFSIRYQFDLWKLFLREENLETLFPHITIPSSSSLSPTREYICVNGLTICQAILDLCNLTFATSLVLFALFLALLFASIPLLFIFLYPSLYSLQSLPPSLTTPFILYWISSFTINFLQFNALVAMMMVCTADAYRKYKIFVLISSLIRPHDVDMDLMHITTTTPSSSTLPSKRLSFSTSTPPSSTGPGTSTAWSEMDRREKRKTSILLPNRGTPPLSLPRKPVEKSQIFPINEEEVPTSIESREPEAPETQLPMCLPITKQYAFKAYVGDDSQSIVPRLDFDLRNNIFSWSSIRLVFHNFGERMKFRIDSYFGKNNLRLPLSFALLSICLSLCLSLSLSPSLSLYLSVSLSPSHSLSLCLSLSLISPSLFLVSQP
jgi:hypothetical protein